MAKQPLSPQKLRDLKKELRTGAKSAKENDKPLTAVFKSIANKFGTSPGAVSQHYYSSKPKKRTTSTTGRKSKTNSAGRKRRRAPRKRATASGSLIQALLDRAAQHGTRAERLTAQAKRESQRQKQQLALASQARRTQAEAAAQLKRLARRSQKI